MNGTLDIEQEDSKMHSGVIFSWVIYIASESGPWVEDGTGYATRKEAIKAARKWAKKLGITITNTP